MHTKRNTDTIASQFFYTNWQDRFIAAYMKSDVEAVQKLLEEIEPNLGTRSLGRNLYLDLAAASNAFVSEGLNAPVRNVIDAWKEKNGLKFAGRYLIGHSVLNCEAA